MNNKSKSFLLVFSILILISSACRLTENLGGSKDDSPEPEDMLRSEAGGYAFSGVPDWDFEEEEGLTMLTSPDGDIDVGPKFLLTGGLIVNGATSNEELLEEFTGNPEIDYSDADEIEVDGYEGLTVDLSGDFEGTPIEGRIVVVLVSEEQFFQMIGIAPEDLWKATEKQFDAVVSSITFFEPQSVVKEEQIPVQEVEIAPQLIQVRQWASGATASSEYDNPGWAASQATGEPNTPECEDLDSAWASAGDRSVEWLQVTFDQPVIPLEVHIHQTHSPSQIVRVELLDVTGGYHEIYTAVPKMTDCPYILSISTEGIDVEVQGVKITIDQTRLDLPWNEIDAVELVGYKKATTAVQPTREPTRASPQPADRPTATSAGPVADQEKFATWKWSVYGTAQGLSDEVIKTVAVAPDGRLWAGTAKNGIASFKDGVFTNYTVADGLVNNVVKAIAIAPDGSIWVGTGLGLSHYHGGNWTNYTKKDGLVYDEIESLAVAQDGTVWVGTALGLSRFDGQTWTTYRREQGLVDNFIADMAFDARGNLWFATYGGVSYFDGSNFTNYTVADGLAYKIVVAVGVAQDGSVWFSTSGSGVSRFDGSSWTTYLEAGDYDLKYVKAIVADKDGGLWFTTEGKGVYRFDGRGWLNFRKANGLAYDWVDAMALAPDGSLWFGCRKGGLAHFGP